MLHACHGQQDRARALLEQAARVSPDHPGVLTAQGALLENDHGHSEQAGALFQRALEARARPGSAPHEPASGRMCRMPAPAAPACARWLTRAARGAGRAQVEPNHATALGHYAVYLHQVAGVPAPRPPGLASLRV